MTDNNPLGIFGKYLFVWVALAAGVGVLIGYFAPEVPEALKKATIAQVSLPIAVCIWLMVLPMIIEIDLKSIVNVRKNMLPITVTSGINYLIQPFTMYALAVLFFSYAFKDVIGDSELENEYIAGAVVLGGSPCTAMVFVWSLLTNGDPAYTLVQVAFNDLLIFIFYIPTLMLLLQVTNIKVPWETAFFSVALFMLIPGVIGVVVRQCALKYRNQDWLDGLLKRFKPVTMGALVVTVVLIFTFQGDSIVNNPVHVLLIALPLTLQSYFIFALTYCIFYKKGVQHRFAAPGAMIATSNFFELAVAVAISLFGTDSGATLVTVVGVLVEVPVMLSMVWFANKTRDWFPPVPESEADTLPKSFSETTTLEKDQQQQQPTTIVSTVRISYI
eukprot:m.41366 g.41366  ORF g.41366 m.41366 type:complete len:387 (-) comp18786_c0_seq1:194-1354(-)